MLRTDFSSNTPQFGTAKNTNKTINAHSPALKVLCLNRSEDLLAPAMDQLLLSKSAQEKEQASETVRLFLNHDGNPNLKNKARNPYLSESIRHKKPNLFRQLLNTVKVNGKSSITNPDPVINPDVNQANGLGTTLLMTAVIHQNRDAVQALLNQGADVMAQDWAGRTACDWAALKGDMPLVKILTRHAGPNISPEKKDELKKLARDQKTRIQSLQKLTPERKRQEFIEANHTENFSKIIALVSAGTPIDVIVNEQNTALHWAAVTSNPKRTKLLAQLGADLNRHAPFDDSPLICAIFGTTLLSPDANHVETDDDDANHVKTVQALIDAGADVNLSIEGITPLACAFVYGKMELIKPLLQAGANAKVAVKYTAPLTGLPVLMRAIYHGADTEVVKAIIKAGADVNARQKDGGTALMAAAYRGNIENVKVLLSAGADVRPKTDEKSGQKTALMIAEAKGHKDIAQLLRDAEANPAQPVS